MATRRDLPEGTITPSRRRTTRMLVITLLGLVVLGGGAFAAYQLREHPKTAIAEPSGDEGGSADTDPRIGRRRAVIKDNGEVIATVTVPDPVIHGTESRARIELKNKLGQPLVADEVVLTIADSTGAARGLTARPARNVENRMPGRFYFAYTFPQKGHYTLRVFTPGSDSTLELPVDVE